LLKYIKCWSELTSVGYALSLPIMLMTRESLAQASTVRSRLGMPRSTKGTSALRYTRASSSCAASLKLKTLREVKVPKEAGGSVASGFHASKREARGKRAG